MTLRRKPPAGNVGRVVPHGKSSRGVVTNKKGRTVQYGSFAQRRLLLVLERDRTVSDYASRPEEIQYLDNGKLKTFVPDFIVWRTGGQVELHHVSYSPTGQGQGKGQEQIPAMEYAYGRHQGRSVGLASSTQPWRSAVEKLCAGRGWTFVQHYAQPTRLPQETQAAASTHYPSSSRRAERARAGAQANKERSKNSLPEKAELANLLALEYFEPRCHRNDEIADAALELLQDGESIPYGKLLQQVASITGSPLPRVEETLLHLLWHCELQTDLDRLLFSCGSFDRRAYIERPD